MSPETANVNKQETTIQHSLDGFSYVLVPAALYQEDLKEKYLDFLGLMKEGCVVCTDYIEAADAYNVYCLPEKKEFRHPTSILLENLIKENKERTDDARIYLNIKDQQFEMIVLKGTKLLFYNTFRFKTKEDFLYFLLFSIEQLHLEAESVPVYFLGMIEEDSKLVEFTSRYVRDIRFKKEIKCE
ncbi:MAG: DUF3822 family protein [Bacteroidales bacterium]|nr:DUF3822 family protein [Bacteroidales bacterium]